MHQVGRTLAAHVNGVRKRPLGHLGGVLILLFVVTAVFAPALATHDPYKQDLFNSLSTPSAAHWLGTDELGRDVFSRLVYGSRTSLLIAVSAATFGLLIGGVIGLSAGHFGGRFEVVVMRMIDILLAFPSLILALAVVAIMGPGLQSVIIGVGVHSVPTFARVARSATLTTKVRDFVMGAYSLGASPVRVMAAHVLPNIATHLITLWTLRLGNVVLIAAALSFLGLGVQAPTPEWGSMASEGRSYLQLAPHLMYYPGLAVALLVLSFNLVGDALQDARDPRS